MKILYAASNSIGAKIRLHRFLNAIQGKKYNLKIAAYLKSSPSVSIDWTLNAMFDLYSDKISFDNDNLRIYYDQIKLFKPDLIISDLEIFTSYVANLLDIPCWQVSPLLLEEATARTGLSANYSSKYKNLFNVFPNNYWGNLISNSDKRLIYSHFCDTNLIQIKPNYEWVRPYYIEGKVSQAAEHNVVAISPNTNNKIISFCQKYKDTIFFLDKTENFNKIENKSLLDRNEYSFNLKNCNYFLSEGYSSFMADAFYNKQYAFVMPDFTDQECIMNSLYAKKYNLGEQIYVIDPIFNKKEIDYKLSDAEFLHQKIEKL